MEDKSGAWNLSYKCRMVRMSPWNFFIYFHSENRSWEEKHKSNAGADLCAKFVGQSFPNCSSLFNLPSINTLSETWKRTQESNNASINYCDLLHRARDARKAARTAVHMVTSLKSDDNRKPGRAHTDGQQHAPGIVHCIRFQFRVQHFDTSA